MSQAGTLTRPILPACACARVGGRCERAEPVAACDQLSVPRAASEGEPQPGRVFWVWDLFNFNIFFAFLLFGGWRGEELFWSGTVFLGDG